MGDSVEVGILGRIAYSHLLLRKPLCYSCTVKRILTSFEALVDEVFDEFSTGGTPLASRSSRRRTLARFWLLRERAAGWAPRGHHSWHRMVSTGVCTVSPVAQDLRLHCTAEFDALYYSMVGVALAAVLTPFPACCLMYRGDVVP